MLFDFYFSESMLLAQEWMPPMFDPELQERVTDSINSVFINGELLRYTVMCRHGKDHGCNHADVLFLGTATIDEIRCNDPNAKLPVELSEKYYEMKKLMKELEEKIH
ncbi:hypothetical protein BRE01_62770 [Brevibacillus reuszeri]|uniref:Uncharacterized protein n=1 Tax=Brevibacillus reuszeri TaxID=54915 RepID=A0ABQ0TXY6_9BACL|nr:hypothetical protein [Brevibacillus reuszeri]GED72575.1 hypothetical protein BRE01_62770 [Brevibacillus reuszeri]